MIVTDAFGNEIQRTIIQRLQRGLRPLFRQRTHHDHRPGGGFHDLLQCRQAVHARHFDIHGDHIRIKRADFLERIFSVSGAADNLDVGILGNKRGQSPAHKSGIIDNENINHPETPHNSQ